MLIAMLAAIGLYVMSLDDSDEAIPGDAGQRSSPSYGG